MTTSAYAIGEVPQNPMDCLRLPGSPDFSIKIDPKPLLVRLREHLLAVGVALEEAKEAAAMVEPLQKAKEGIEAAIAASEARASQTIAELHRRIP